jgi:hypothetical protein
MSLPTSPTTKMKTTRETEQYVPVSLNVRPLKLEVRVLLLHQTVSWTMEVLQEAYHEEEYLIPKVIGVLEPPSSSVILMMLL